MNTHQAPSFLKDNSEIVSLRDRIAAEYGPKRICTVEMVAATIYRQLPPTSFFSDDERINAAVKHAVALCRDSEIFTFIAPRHIPLEGGIWAEIASVASRV